ncbi:MAG: hypothetical protein M1832_002879 [Thelocarpon impressellum]|nr:MAG: hypothetical protein M1832_002879 [Thelocarpon impressellum]
MSYLHFKPFFCEACLSRMRAAFILAALSLFLGTRGVLGAPRSHHEPVHPPAPAGFSAGPEYPSTRRLYSVLIDREHSGAPALSDLMRQFNLSAEHPHVKYVYDNPAFRGFSGYLEQHAVAALRGTDGVEHVGTSAEARRCATDTRPNATWSLERVSQFAPVDGGDLTQPEYTYTYDGTAEPGDVDVYIIDSGIKTEHVAFGGRASMGWSSLASSKPGDAVDPTGHGTRCAGVVGSYPYGAAANANLIGVRAISPGGTDDILAGLDYVLTRHKRRRQEAAGKMVGSVVSMSFTIADAQLSRTARRLAAEGIHVAAAAGNDGGTACTTHPAAAGGQGQDVVTVGSISGQDKISTFSNTGPCVDIYAPGESILSTTIGADNDATALDQGTSMAAPLVAGVMAYLMSVNATLGQSPRLMKQRLLELAIARWVPAPGASDPSSQTTISILNNGHASLPAPPPPPNDFGGGPDVADGTAGTDATGATFGAEAPGGTDWYGGLRRGRVRPRG